MDRTRYQFSLFSLLVLTTVCAVLMSLAKTFPAAALWVAGLALMTLGPLLFFLGSLPPTTAARRCQDQCHHVNHFSGTRGT